MAPRPALVVVALLAALAWTALGAYQSCSGVWSFWTYWQYEVEAAGVMSSQYNSLCFPMSGQVRSANSSVRFCHNVSLGYTYRNEQGAEIDVKVSESNITCTNGTLWTNYTAEACAPSYAAEFWPYMVVDCVEDAGCFLQAQLCYEYDFVGLAWWAWVLITVSVIVVAVAGAVLFLWYQKRRQEAAESVGQEPLLSGSPYVYSESAGGKGSGATPALPKRPNDGLAGEPMVVEFHDYAIAAVPGTTATATSGSTGTDSVADPSDE